MLGMPEEIEGENIGLFPGAYIANHVVCLINSKLVGWEYSRGEKSGFSDIAVLPKGAGKIGIVGERA